MNIPPVIFYALGSMLAVFGALRAWHLGRRRVREADEPETTRQRSGRRRHLAMGILWVGMGLYVIYLAFELERERSRAPLAQPPASEAPRVRIVGP